LSREFHTSQTWAGEQAKLSVKHIQFLLSEMLADALNRLGSLGHFVGPIFSP